jgi:hypothetical protein
MDVKTVSWCTRVMFCRPFKRRVEVTEKGRIFRRNWKSNDSWMAPHVDVCPCIDS